MRFTLNCAAIGKNLKMDSGHYFSFPDDAGMHRLHIHKIFLVHQLPLAWAGAFGGVWFQFIFFPPLDTPQTIIIVFAIRRAPRHAVVVCEIRRNEYHRSRHVNPPHSCFCARAAGVERRNGPLQLVSSTPGQACARPFDRRVWWWPDYTAEKTSRPGCSPFPLSPAIKDRGRRQQETPHKV